LNDGDGKKKKKKKKKEKKEEKKNLFVALVGMMVMFI
jgi:hypothetical protein